MQNFCDCLQQENFLCSPLFNFCCSSNKKGWSVRKFALKNFASPLQSHRVPLPRIASFKSRAFMDFPFNLSQLLLAIAVGR